MMRIKKQGQIARSRVILFAVLERLGVFYVLNVVLGIVVVAAMSFILYDKVVFRNGV